MLGNLKFHLRLAWHLAAGEFARRRALSFGGVVWMVAVPLATIVTIWIAIDFGLGLRAIMGPGFGHGLVSGMLIWLFFVDAVSGASVSIVSQPHLVKKLRFPTILLPIASVMVAAFTHSIVAAFVILILAFSGAEIGMMTFLLPLFFIIAFMLATGFGALLAATNVFIPDVGQVLPAVLGLWFWLTPIVWPLSRIAPEWQFVAFINPLAPIVAGYGSALANAPLPFDMVYLPLLTLLTTAFCGGCLYFFGRMQYAFADVI